MLPPRIGNPSSNVSNPPAPGPSRLARIVRLIRFNSELKEIEKDHPEDAKEIGTCTKNYTDQRFRSPITVRLSTLETIPPAIEKRLNDRVDSLNLGHFKKPSFSPNFKGAVNIFPTVTTRETEGDAKIVYIENSCQLETLLNVPKASSVTGRHLFVTTLKAQEAERIQLEECRSLTTLDASKATFVHIMSLSALTTLNAPEAGQLYAINCNPNGIVAYLNDPEQTRNLRHLAVEGTLTWNEVQARVPEHIWNNRAIQIDVKPRQAQALDMDYGQNTHQEPVHLASSISAWKLREMAGGRDYDLSTLRSEIEKLEADPSDRDKNKTAQIDENGIANFAYRKAAAVRLLDGIPNDGRRGVEQDPDTDMTFEQKLKYLICAIENAQDLFKPTIKTKDDALRVLVTGLYDVQRGENHNNKSHMDNGGQDRPICFAGGFNKLSETTAAIFKGFNATLDSKTIINKIKSKLKKRIDRGELATQPVSCEFKAQKLARSIQELFDSDDKSDLYTAGHVVAAIVERLPDSQELKDAARAVHESLSGRIRQGADQTNKDRQDIEIFKSQLVKAIETRYGKTEDGFEKFITDIRAILSAKIPEEKARTSALAHVVFVKEVKIENSDENQEKIDGLFLKWTDGLLRNLPDVSGAPEGIRKKVETLKGHAEYESVLGWTNMAKDYLPEWGFPAQPLPVAPVAEAGPSK